MRTPWNELSPVNWVAELFHNQCSPQPIIYVELAAMAYLAAYSSIVLPDIKEDIKLLTGKSWLKHGKAALKEADGPHKPILKKAGGLIVSGAEAVDKFMWWSFVTGVLNGTASAFVTAAYQTQPCARPGALHWAKSSFPIGFFDSWDKWQVGPAWFAASGTDGPSFASLMPIPQGAAFWMYCGFKLEPFLGLGKVESVTIRLRQGATHVIKEWPWDANSAAEGDTPFGFYYGQPTGYDTFYWWEFIASVSGVVFELHTVSGAAAYEYWFPGSSSPEPMHLLAPKRRNFEDWMLHQAAEFLKYETQ